MHRTPSPTRTLRVTLVAATAFGLVATSAAASPAAPAPAAPATASARPTPGAPGIGDPYYPDYGNGGYDVAHYDVKVGFTPKSGLLTGTTTITATATQDLSRFDLDLALQATQVTVDGKPVKFAQPTAHELQVRAPWAKGHTAKIVVTYAGVPARVEVDGISPWVTTKDGGVAVGEPEMAAWWFPSNDHPRDKATFDVALTVPKGLEAISNGTLRKTAYGKTTDTWSWHEKRPMAPYLAFMAVGEFDITKGVSNSGIPFLNAVASGGGDEAKFAAQDLARTPEVVDWLASQFGAYPFDVTGGVAPAADIGFALENQTRPVYSRKFWRKGNNIGVTVHELAHQWFGDAVSVENWKDIWLNEGFASWAEWRWKETHDGPTAAATFQKTYDAYAADNAKFWNVVVSDPGPGKEFSSAVYDRGAMTLQALRTKVGDPAFFSIMRGWAKKHRYGNATVGEFVAYASKQSGQDLTSFFRTWLSTPGKPTPSAALGFPASMIPKAG